MPTAAEIKAAKAKATVKYALGNFSGVSSASSLKEEGRFTIVEAMRAGLEFGRVFLTKPRTDDKGELIVNTGGKPGVWMKLPAKILAKYEMENEDADSITVFFHNSAKPILEITGNKLAKEMDVVEVWNEEDETFSFLITATGATLDSKTLESDLVSIA